MKEAYSHSAFTETGRHPDNENQSDGRTETIDSNIFKSSKSKLMPYFLINEILTCSF